MRISLEIVSILQHSFMGAVLTRRDKMPNASIAVVSTPILVYHARCLNLSPNGVTCVILSVFTIILVDLNYPFYVNLRNCSLSPMRFTCSSGSQMHFEMCHVVFIPFY